ncbi:MAG: penicillin acylase family protein [Acidimicrobiia bacterium]|nr:MAG: penicillin acylase family protein [Acidimicrobiia bacterium]
MSDTASPEPGTKRHRIRSILKKVLWVGFALVIILAISGSLFARYSVRRAFPQTNGTIQIAGLKGEVEIIRDSMGIPHIYADNVEDLFLAQGYVHAQDRFYQMDFWRKISYGELSSMFGSSQIETDTFIRTLGWGRLAEIQYERETEENRVILDAYAAGVNAYLATQSPSDLSFEYSILELLNHNYTPEPWTGAQSLAWGKVMAWDLGGNHGTEIDRALALGSLPPERVAQLYPSYPGDRNPYIVELTDAVAMGTPVELRVPVSSTVALQSAGAAIDALNRITGGGSETGIGSNSWAVSGDLTPTGSPQLMNDPHLSSQMPSIWYQVGLHCRTVTEECPYDVAGFSFAGVPGVVIGHNANIAWGFTNVGPDVQDLYIEKINPDNPNQYELNGEWVDMEVRTEIIEVAGSGTREVTVRSTRHGPIISGIYEPLDDFDMAGVDLPDNYAVAFRWTGLDDVPSVVGPILGIDRASDFDEFREAAFLFAVPAQNLLYADIEGNIGYQMPGNIPIRANGDGTVPVPGWTDEYEWNGFIPYEDLPVVLNPESGYIVTANNAVIDEGYPYLITKDWDYGYRARRIVDLVTSNFGIGLEDQATIQFDSYDLNAERIIPFLEGAMMAAADRELGGLELDALRVLSLWDRQNFANSTGAAVWNVTWRNLLARTFRDELPEQLWPEGNSRWFEVVWNLLDAPNDAFWDDVTTPKVETRDDILVESFFAAVDELRDTLGGEVASWKWGDLHTMTFVNQSLGLSGVGLIDDRFNRGPFPASGSKSVVNAVGWTATEGYEVDWLPSMRMLVDLGDLTKSRAIHTTGQSGHVDNEHYDDMIPLWLAGETAPFLWDRSDVEADAEARLILSP